MLALCCCIPFKQLSICFQVKFACHISFLVPSIPYNKEFNIQLTLTPTMHRLCSGSAGHQQSMHCGIRYSLEEQEVVQVRVFLREYFVIYLEVSLLSPTQRPQSISRCFLVNIVFRLRRKRHRPNFFLPDLKVAYLSCYVRRYGLLTVDAAVIVFIVMDHQPKAWGCRLTIVYIGGRKFRITARLFMQRIGKVLLRVEKFDFWGSRGVQEWIQLAVSLSLLRKRQLRRIHTSGYYSPPPLINVIEWVWQGVLNFSGQSPWLPVVTSQNRPSRGIQGCLQVI